MENERTSLKEEKLVRVVWAIEDVKRIEKEAGKQISEMEHIYRREAGKLPRELIEKGHNLLNYLKNYREKIINSLAKREEEIQKMEY